MSRPRKYERAESPARPRPGLPLHRGSCGRTDDALPAVALLYRTGKSYGGDAACAKHVPKHLRPARSARTKHKKGAFDTRPRA